MQKILNQCCMVPSIHKICKVYFANNMRKLTYVLELERVVTISLAVSVPGENIENNAIHCSGPL